MSHFRPSSAADRPTVEMTDEEVAEYLERSGDGVLTLHTGVQSSFPVSFGYQRETGRCLFQIFSRPDSDKRDGLSDGTATTLVVYDVNSPDDWTSVVFDGVLERVSVPDADRRRTYAEQATPVGLSVFDADETELEATWYELRPETVTGRKSPT